MIAALRITSGAIGAEQIDTALLSALNVYDQASPDPQQGYFLYLVTDGAFSSATSSNLFTRHPCRYRDSLRNRGIVTTLNLTPSSFDNFDQIDCLVEDLADIRSVSDTPGAFARVTDLAPVPVPPALPLLGGGLLILVGLRRRARRAAA